MNCVSVIGVGPGSDRYITSITKNIILESDIVVGYKFTLETIKNLIKNKIVYEVTIRNQEEIYNKIKKTIKNKKIVIPFTGDVNFSESEIVDRLIEIFGDVNILPGISSVQVAASKSKVPIDKAKVITFHVSTSIEYKKIELQKALLDGFSVIILPRPWPTKQKNQFMQSDIAYYLKKSGFDTTKLKVFVYELLTTCKEKTFVGTVKDLEDRTFSDLSIIVIDQTKLELYSSINR